MSSILVVEDDRSTRQFLTEMLKTAGFSVASAKDGVDALKRLRAGSYDVEGLLHAAIAQPEDDPMAHAIGQSAQPVCRQVRLHVSPVEQTSVSRRVALQRPALSPTSGSART